MSKGKKENKPPEWVQWVFGVAAAVVSIVMGINDIVNRLSFMAYGGGTFGHGTGYYLNGIEAVINGVSFVAFGAFLHINLFLKHRAAIPENIVKWVRRSLVFTFVSFFCAAHISSCVKNYPGGFVP